MVKSRHFKSESFAVGTIAAGLLSDCPLVCHPSRGEMRSLAEQERERAEGREIGFAKWPSGERKRRRRKGNFDDHQNSVNVAAVQVSARSAFVGGVSHESSPPFLG